MKWAKQTGFTIVELLIVVVVIAILAAITIVAFNGITKQAQTTAYSAAADQLDKTLRLAAVQNSGLTTKPLPASPAYICFGTVEDYPAEGAFNAGDCYIRYNDGVETNRYSTSSDFVDQVNALQLNLKVGNHPAATIESGGSKELIRGYLGYIIEAGNTKTIFIEWVPPDRSSCSRGNELIGVLYPNIQSSLDQLISIRDGEKTIEEVYGAGSTMTMQDVLDQIANYQNIINVYGTMGICILSASV